MQDTAKQARGGFFSKLSLEQKIPLVIGGLLLVVILSLSAAAILEVRGAAKRVASERVVRVTQQFATALQLSATQLRAQVTATASSPALAGYAGSNDVTARAAALQALTYHGPQPEQVIATELRDSTGQLLLSTASASDTGPRVPVGAMTDALHRDSASVGRFRRLVGGAGYPAVAPVKGAPGLFVVQWRKVQASPKAREQMATLVGTSATLLIGNADGTYATDLEKEVTLPKRATAPTSTPQEMPGDSGAVLASIAPIPRTPWMVSVAFPMRAIFAPVDAFIGRMAIIGVVALLVALAVAWTMSRRLTAPLSQLATAADAIAAGDFSQRAQIGRGDELGRLGDAFDLMAAEVDRSRGNLEHLVEERTRELNDTLFQLHETQESLVRREKLAMLGQLASGVGHELRNPLGVMTNAVYYLKMVLASSPSNVIEYLDILQQQITLSEKIVSDLLDFARLKSPQRSPASLGDVMSAQIARLGSTNGVAIETQFPTDLPNVLVDSVQVGQIILNLLTNAMQAMDYSGRIKVQAHTGEQVVHCDVTDSGPGVAPENVAKIFEPLFTTKARGIGLGLAVSRTLARANEGDLTLATTFTQGATFRLTLPVAAAN